MLKKIILGVLVLVTANSFAQDIHFSQFLNSPMNLNPAMTGAFEGGYRIIGNGRRQWNSVTIPYQTFGMSLDAHNFLQMKGVGAGLSIYNDNTGDSRLNTFQVNLAGSYTIPIAKSQTVTLGIQSGFTQRRINNKNLRFDNQFDGNQFDPSLAANESIDNFGRIYPNFNAGLLYTKKIGVRKSFSAGTSLYNINKPEQSYFDNLKIGLDRLVNMTFAGQWPLGKKTDLLPSILVMGQGKYRQYTVGSSLKYTLENKTNNYRAIYAGLWTRAADAAFVNVGMDYNNLFVGLSYDINYSRLTPASNYRGGLEIAIIYILNPPLPKRLKYKYCPEFI